MDSFASIITVIGVPRLAEALGQRPGTVRNWRNRSDAIPPAFWLKTEELARKEAAAETDPKRRADLERITVARMAEIAAAKAASSEAA